MLIKSLQLTFKQVKKLLKPDPETQDTLMDYQFWLLMIKVKLTLAVFSFKVQTDMGLVLLVMYLMLLKETP